jgi:hypothetical protein
MSPQTTRLVFVACALVFFSDVSAAPQTRLKGRVHTPGDNPLVAHEQVAIEGDGRYDTEDHGEFEFDLAGDLKVGQTARFHVYHVNPKIEVQQWIVISPCDNENGRTLSLPAVGSRPISIVVLPRGDLRLKSVNQVSLLVYQCVIEEGTSQFKPASRSGGSNRSSLFYGGSSLMADQVEYRPLYKNQVSRCFPRVVAAAYRVHAQEMPPVSSLRDARDSTLLDEAFVARKTAELGLTREELLDALNAWTRSVEERYQKGLAARYERRYTEASSHITASIPSPPGEFLKSTGRPVGAVM